MFGVALAGACSGSHTRLDDAKASTSRLLGVSGRAEVESEAAGVNSFGPALASTRGEVLVADAVAPLVKSRAWDGTEAITHAGFCETRGAGV